jgi:hypothetical protein
MERNGPFATCAAVAAPSSPIDETGPSDPTRRLNITVAPAKSTKAATTPEALNLLLPALLARLAT